MCHMLCDIFGNSNVEGAQVPKSESSLPWIGTRRWQSFMTRLSPKHQNNFTCFLSSLLWYLSSFEIISHERWKWYSFGIVPSNFPILMENSQPTRVFPIVMNKITWLKSKLSGRIYIYIYILAFVKYERYMKTYQTNLFNFNGYLLNKCRKNV